MFLQVKKFKPVIVSPNQQVVLLTILPKEGNFKNLKIESGLVLHTNISEVTVPLLMYNGKLNTVSVETKTIAYFFKIIC